MDPRMFSGMFAQMALVLMAVGAVLFAMVAGLLWLGWWLWHHIAWLP